MITNASYRILVQIYKGKTGENKSPANKHDGRTPLTMMPIIGYLFMFISDLQNLPPTKNLNIFII